MIRKTLYLVALLFAALLAHSQRPEFNIHAADSITKGIELHEEGLYEEAIALFDQVHPGDTNYAWAVYQKAMSFSTKEDNERAIEVANEGLHIGDTTNAEFFNVIGGAYDNLGQEEKALEVYNQGIERFPMNALLYFNRAVVYENMDRHADMLADLKKSVEINPFHASSHLKLAHLAINEEEYAPALLSLGYFLMLEPRGERANSNLVFFNNAMMGDADLKRVGLKLSEPADDFKKLNLLVKSRVALREDYKQDSDIDLALIRQLHLTIAQASKTKKLTGFWENYYIPFYKSVTDAELFEPLSYYILLSSGSSEHQKTIEKNASDINAFISWGGAQLRETHGRHISGYIAGNEETRYWFYDGSNQIEAVGQADKDDEPIGPYTFYYATGSVSSEGDFETGKLTGTWNYYHPNRSLSARRVFKDAKKHGLSEEFYDNGYRSSTAGYEEGVVQGVVDIYNRNGYLERTMFYKDDVIQDSIVYYYPHGAKNRFLPIKDGLMEGKAFYYHEDGSLSSEIEYKADKRHGPFVDYFPDGTVSGKGAYKEGMFHGDYSTYYPNGNPKSQGAYFEGARIGDWEYYYYNGKLESKATYDEKGKENGISESYEPSGHLTHRFVYSKGEIKEYYHFGRKSEVIHEDKRRFGKFRYVGYSIDGIKSIEGDYQGDHKEGPWKYYSTNGDLIKEENYDSEGLMEGEYTTFYSFGAVSRKTTLSKDYLNGYDAFYHPNGEISEHGYSVEGERNGIWEFNFKDGKPSIQNFYVKGKANGRQYYYDVAGDLYLMKDFDMGILTDVYTCTPDTDILYHHHVHLEAGTERAYYPHGGISYEIPLVGGEYNGRAKWYYGNGKVSTEGNYLNGNRHGAWTWRHPNGELNLEGTYLFGEHSGTWKDYYASGKLKAEYTYENGNLHGVYRAYYEDGKPEYEQNYDQGTLEGRYTFYDVKGNVNHIRHYESGKIIGYSYLGKDGKEVAMIPLKMETGKAKSYYPNGKTSREYEVEHGRFIGKYRTYHENGGLSYEATYKNDLRDGNAKEHYPDGTLQSSIDYHLNDYHGEYVTYWPTGKVRVKGTYLNDERHGIFEEYSEDGRLMTKYEYNNGQLIKEL